MNVFDLIRSRLRGVKDNYHLALSVEGGMMRGAVSAGMIEELHLLRADKLFNSYWGSSIGAINAAYLAAEDAAGRSELYAEAAEGALFRDRFHPVHGAINLDWLFNTGLQDLQSLDFEKLNGSNLNFLVTRSGWSEARNAVDLFKPETSSEWRELLNGACRAPIAAGLPVGALRGGLWDADMKTGQWDQFLHLEQHIFLF